MSSESKKKRGESGQKNAQSIPFRGNGLPPDWEAKARGVYRHPADHTGTHMVRGAIGGFLAAALGYPFGASHRLSDLVDRSLEHCPSAAAVFEAIEPQPAQAQAA